MGKPRHSALGQHRQQHHILHYRRLTCNLHFVVSNNFVVENNIVFGAHLAISEIETFERNYWSDYLERYPNASEVDSSGVWDTPYSIADSTGFENPVFQDNHPLVNVVSIPNFASTLPTITPPRQFSITLFLLFASVIIAMMPLAIGAFAYFKKTRVKRNNCQTTKCSLN
ncbi:MAG: hypothetical protein QXV09_07475 [Candidatus Bathyarchaeia archaeon]